MRRNRKSIVIASQLLLLKSAFYSGLQCLSEARIVREETKEDLSYCERAIEEVHCR